MSDQIRFEILEDGTIKSTTGEIGEINHLSAEQFLKNVQRELGGVTETHKLPSTHVETHNHIHAHV